MNESLQPLLNLLSGHFGWMATAVSWIGASRIALKFVNAWLQQKLTSMMATAAADPAAESDWEAVLSKRGYRVVSFVLDLVFSLKLPTVKDFLAAKAQGAQKTEGTGSSKI